MASGNDKGRGLSDAFRQANLYSFNSVLMLGLMDIMLYFVCTMIILSCRL